MAKAARCGVATARYVESTSGRPRPAALTRVRAAFEAAGIEFTDGDAPGVELRAERGDDARTPQ